ncbi:hypothetical protein ACXX83_09020 [Pseudomonas sp. GNP012]
MCKHTENSSFREKLVEHPFVGELLKLSWCSVFCDLDVAKLEVDNSGYDLVAEARRVVRHVQLKASFVDSKTAPQNIHLSLAGKPSECVAWRYFNEETLVLGPFLYFGGRPGNRLPTVEGMQGAKHARGNQSGHKTERPNIRVINKVEFKSFESVEGIYSALFGAPISN